MTYRQGAGGLTAALELLDRSRGSLLTAGRATTSNDRYIAAHLGALRAGAALLTRTPVPGARGRGGPVRTVWQGIGEAAPELREWADYFAVCGTRRTRLETGCGYASLREADDLLRAAETFAGLVQAALGLPITRTEPILAVVARS